MEIENQNEKFIYNLHNKGISRGKTILSDFPLK